MDLNQRNSSLRIYFCAITILMLLGQAASGQRSRLVLQGPDSGEELSTTLIQAVETVLGRPTFSTSESHYDFSIVVHLKGPSPCVTHIRIVDQQDQTIGERVLESDTGCGVSEELVLVLAMMIESQATATRPPVANPVKPSSVPESAVNQTQPRPQRLALLLGAHGRLGAFDLPGLTAAVGASLALTFKRLTLEIGGSIWPNHSSTFPEGEVEVDMWRGQVSAHYALTNSRRWQLGTGFYAGRMTAQGKDFGVNFTEHRLAMGLSSGLRFRIKMDGPILIHVDAAAELWVRRPHFVVVDTKGELLHSVRPALFSPSLTLGIFFSL